MKPLFLATLVIGGYLPATLSGAQDELGQVAGDWRGDSTCVAKGTACRDEVVVYHIAVLPSKPSSVSVSADKIVDGRAINMGTLEFRYEPKDHLLICEYSQGVWRMKVDGQAMEGTLTRADNSKFRHITLRKD